MKTNFLGALMILTSALFIACGNNEHRKLLVVGEAGMENFIVFDDKDTLHFNGLIDSFFLSSGRHNYTWKGKSQSFYMPETGAVLNLGRQSFVVLAIKFEAENDDNKSYSHINIIKPNFVIVDSFLIFKKVFKDEVSTSEKATQIVQQVMLSQNGNFVPERKFDKYADDSDYDSNQRVYGFKKIGAEQVLIPKFWNYDLGQEVPEYITVRRPKGGGMFGNVPETKSVMLLAEDFLEYAESMPNTFEVMDVSDIMLEIE